MNIPSWWRRLWRMGVSAAFSWKENPASLPRRVLQASRRVAENCSVPHPLSGPSQVLFLQKPFLNSASRWPWKEMDTEEQVQRWSCSQLPVSLPQRGLSDALQVYLVRFICPESRASIVHQLHVWTSVNYGQTYHCDNHNTACANVEIK